MLKQLQVKHWLSVSEADAEQMLLKHRQNKNGKDKDKDGGDKVQPILFLNMKGGDDMQHRHQHFIFVGTMLKMEGPMFKRKGVDEEAVLMLKLQDKLVVIFLINSGGDDKEARLKLIFRVMHDRE